jgi:nucleoside-diphosphate-sugar epimerase
MENNNDNKNISILGCGWLGLAVSGRFISEGWSVKGSTRKYEKSSLLQKVGIRNFVIDLNPYVNGNVPVFLESDILLICIPPSIRTQAPGFHVRQMENFVPFIEKSTIKHIIYISSTAVYPDGNHTYKEDDINPEGGWGHADIFFAEETLKSNFKEMVTILRCGGLTGYDRLLAKHFAGRQDIAGGHVPVNLVHRDDVVEVIHTIIEKNAWGKTFNVVSPLHPTREEFYVYEAKKYGLALPTFSDENQTPWKIVDSSRLILDLGYNFKFNDPRNFTYTV